MKMLRLTPENTQTLRQILLEQMEKELTQVGTTTKIKMQYDIHDLFALNKDLVKPVIGMTPLAWIKIRMLTLNYNHEIALHGTVKQQGNKYIITDVFAYPQHCQAAHVESQDDKYPKWLMDLPDETINTMRFQYHSHPGMSVVPSATDTESQADMMQNVPDFYIFMIGCNKESEFSLWFYDKQQNVIFEPKDLVLFFTGAEHFMKESEPLIAPMPVKIVTPPTSIPYSTPPATARAPYSAPPAYQEAWWEKERRLGYQQFTPPGQEEYDEQDAQFLDREFTRRHRHDEVISDRKVDKRTKEYRDAKRKGAAK